MFEFWFLPLVIACVPFYLLPAIIAFWIRRPNRLLVLALNILALGIFWIPVRGAVPRALLLIPTLIAWLGVLRLATLAGPAREPDTDTGQH